MQRVRPSPATCQPYGLLAVAAVEMANLPWQVNGRTVAVGSSEGRGDAVHHIRPTDLLAAIPPNPVGRRSLRSNGLTLSRSTAPNHTC